MLEIEIDWNIECRIDSINPYSPVLDRLNAIAIQAMKMISKYVRSSSSSKYSLVLPANAKYRRLKLIHVRSMKTIIIDSTVASSKSIIPPSLVPKPPEGIVVRA